MREIALSGKSLPYSHAPHWVVYWWPFLSCSDYDWLSCWDPIPTRVLVLCVGPLNITVPRGQLLAGIPAYFLGLNAPSPFTCPWDTSGPSTSSHLTWWQIFTSSCVLWVSLLAQVVKNLPAVRETWVWFLGWEDPLEEGMAIHSSLLAWRIPIDKGAWQVTVHGVTKSQTWLSN